MCSRWTMLLRRLALVLGLYSLLRALFLVWNYRIFNQAGAGQLALAFVHGLRFDLAAVAATNFIFIFLTFVPRANPPSRSHERLLKGVFIALNLPFLLLNV